MLQRCVPIDCSEGILNLFQFFFCGSEQIIIIIVIVIFQLNKSLLTCFDAVNFYPSISYYITYISPNFSITPISLSLFLAPSRDFFSSVLFVSLSLSSTLSLFIHTFTFRIRILFLFFLLIQFHFPYLLYYSLCCRLRNFLGNFFFFYLLFLLKTILYM